MTVINPLENFDETDPRLGDYTGTRDIAGEYKQVSTERIRPVVESDLAARGMMPPPADPIADWISSGKQAVASFFGITPEPAEMQGATLPQDEKSQSVAQSAQQKQSEPSTGQPGAKEAMQGDMTLDGYALLPQQDPFTGMDKVLTGPFKESLKRVAQNGLAESSTQDINMSKAMDWWRDISNIIGPAVNRKPEEVFDFLVKSADVWFAQYKDKVNFEDWMAGTAIKLAEDASPGWSSNLSKTDKENIIDLADRSASALVGKDESVRGMISRRLEAAGVKADDTVWQDRGEATMPERAIDVAMPTRVADLNDSTLKRTVYAAVANTHEHIGLAVKLTGNAVADFMDSVASLSLPEGLQGAARDATGALRQGVNTFGNEMSSGVSEMLRNVDASYAMRPQGFGEKVAQVFVDIAPFFAGEALATSSGGPAAGFAFGTAWFGAKTREALLKQGASEQEATLGGLANGALNVLSFRLAGWAAGQMTSRFYSEFWSTATEKVGARVITNLSNTLAMQAMPFIDQAVQAVAMGKDVGQAMEMTWN